MAEATNIDELLLGAKNATQPQTPEHQPSEEEIAAVDKVEAEVGQVEDVSHETSEESAAPQNPQEEESEAPKSEETKQSVDIDEYGNPKAPPKLYTQEELHDFANQRIRERFARMERNQGIPQPTQQQMQQQAQATQDGFEHNPDSPETWQQQLETFIERTHHKIAQKQHAQAMQQQQQQKLAEFEDKFKAGVERFPNFREVIGQFDIPNNMTAATQDMKDPAAFFMAAATRAPAELKRIAEMTNPYAQIMEMGKLEAALRQSKPVTKAPKPLTKTTGDAEIPKKTKPKEAGIDDLIAQSDARRRALLLNRTKR